MPSLRGAMARPQQARRKINQHQDRGTTAASLPKTKSTPTHNMNCCTRRSEHWGGVGHLREHWGSCGESLGVPGGQEIAGTLVAAAGNLREYQEIAGTLVDLLHRTHEHLARPARGWTWSRRPTADAGFSGGGEVEPGDGRS
jgi:hypothetical protein